MRRTIGSGLLFSLLSHTALAADLPRTSRPVPPAAPPVFTWTGAHAGLFAGYGAFGRNTQFVCTGPGGQPGGRLCPVLPAPMATADSFIAGSEIGCDWQLETGLVAGAAADHQITRLWGYDRWECRFPAQGGGFYPASVVLPGGGWTISRRSAAGSASPLTGPSSTPPAASPSDRSGPTTT